MGRFSLLPNLTIGRTDVLSEGDVYIDTSDMTVRVKVSTGKGLCFGKAVSCSKTDEQVSDECKTPIENTRYHILKRRK
jgi:hypothetical protein